MMEKKRISEVIMEKIESQKIIDIVSLLICCYGAIIKIINYSHKTAMWYDEIAVAQTIVPRSFWKLCASPMEWSQSSPAGWNYLVKICAIVGNNSIYALRLVSVLSGILLVPMIYLFAKNICKIKYPLVCSAIYSVLSYHVRYSNELKPYIFDCLVVLFIIWIYQKYLENSSNVSLLKLCIIYAIVNWFSFPGLFFICGVMIVITMDLIINIIRDKSIASKNLISQVGIEFIVLLSVLLNLFLWLIKTEDNLEIGVVEFWDKLALPLIPKSSEDFSLIKQIVEQILSTIGIRENLVLSVFAAIAIVFGVAKRRRTEIGVSIALIIMMVASYMHYYPMIARLVLFLSVLIICYGFKLVDVILSYCPKIIQYILVLILLFHVMDSGKELTSFCIEDVTRKDISSGIEYIKNNAENDDAVYVMESTYDFGYYTDYTYTVVLSDGVTPLKTYKGKNYTVVSNGEEAYTYIWTFIQDALDEDVNMILKNDRTYILGVTSLDDKLFDELNKYGSYKIVDVWRGTYLLLFEKD